MIVAFGLASCGGGDGDSASSSAATFPTPGAGAVSRSGNRAPSIQGAPARSLAFGVPYSFLPSASDPDGDALVFSVANLPHWATFDASTGALRGTPGQADVGSYQNVTIGVSDGTHAVVLSPFNVDVVATATGSITLTWYPPTERTDGSRLHDLSGYKLYWGIAHGDYPNAVKIDNPGIATYVIERLTPGTYYLVATAFDAAGIESEFSDVLSAVVR